MQVGLITVDGRQVGIITQATYTPDLYTPALGGDDMPMSGRAGGTDTGKGFHHHGIGHSRPSHGEHEQHRNQHHFPGHQHHPAPGRHHHPGHDQKRATTRDEGAGDIPYYSATGDPFDRERFRQELEAKPWLKEKIKHISAGENLDPRANAAVIETMMNRAVVRGTSLEAQAKRHRSSGVDEGGYYAGYAAGISADKAAMIDRNIIAALRGSNVSNYATDNSSGDLAAREKSSGAFRHHMTINGESFFSPGSAEPALRDKWQRLNRQATEAKTAATKPFDPETMAP